MTQYIRPAELKAMLRDGGELALLDVREEGAHSASHLLYAAPAPLSRLELMVPAMVPRRSARVVLVDAGDGLAERAGDRLGELGYTDVAVLQGGTAAWEGAGYELFSGVHVPSKGFGEVVEHECDTPHISAEELKARLDAGDDVIVLDSRPLDEFEVMNIPGGIDCPGAELVYRVHDLAPDPDTLVVVNCAGRTRSIIGAQSLINAGIPNQVMALKNGTMGWHLAGLELERGQSRTAPGVSAAGLAQAQACAADVAQRFSVPTIDGETLARWQAEQDRRTLYLLDVRSPEEYRAGHPVGIDNAPGGQLVQETETWCATLGARVVLLDNDGVRATMTASWLIQMGWEAVVLAGGIANFEQETGPFRPTTPGIAAAAGNLLSPAALERMLAEGSATVVDLDNSRAFGHGHIPGAWWAVRARLATVLPALPQTANLVFTSADGTLARLAAPEASELTAADVHVLDGGTEAWRQAGLPLQQGLEQLAHDRDDVWLKPYDHADSLEDRMRAYLTWEVDLVDALARDGDSRFDLARR